MRLLLKGGLVCDDHGTFSPMDIEVTDGVVTGRSASFSENGEYDQGERDFLPQFRNPVDVREG